MIIGIDGNEANVAKQVGVSVYASHLLKYFSEKASKDTSFVVYLRNAPRFSMPKEHVFFKYEVVSGPFLWSQLFLPIHLYLKKQCDIFFAPAHYTPRYSPMPNIVTIHDLSYFYYPDEFLKKDLYQLKNWSEYSIKKARKIIAVSKTTKKDILKFYNVNDDDVKVIYNGFEKREKTESKKVLKKYDLEAQKYILFIGTIQPRKNIQLLIRAFNGFSENHHGFKLVIAGKKGWLYEQIFEEVTKYHLDSKVIFTGYVSDEEEVELYSHAHCYVLPSLYEGFGIPILEAMSLDCPVIASNSSGLPEIGADACLYFDTKNEEELLEKLEQLTDNTNLRLDLIRKGRERAKLFSWEKCAEETLNILKSV